MGTGVYFNHCDTWYPKEGDFHGQILTPKSDQNTNDANETLTLMWGNNENPGNTWRLVRIINDTTDWTYVEYIDANFSQQGKEEPFLHVLFDNQKDPYQLHNAYSDISQNVQNELHQMLMTYGSCAGSSCP